MFEKSIFAVAVAASFVGIASNARALDIVPGTPSAQIDATISAPRPGYPLLGKPVDRISPANPNAGHPGYVFVAPVGRQRFDRNADPAPWGRGDADNDGVPNSRDHKPSDPERH